MRKHTNFLKLLLNYENNNKSRLDKEWLQYRIDKQYIAQGDYLNVIASYKRNKVEYFGAVEVSQQQFEPPSGSNYWLTTVNRPNGWGEW